MKKIPTLFERKFENHKVIGITDKITPGCEKAFLEGIATVKVDGSCCAIIDGKFYKRYDAKKGKKAPEGAIPCQPEPDPITGHHPHWVSVDESKPEDKWFVRAYQQRMLRYGKKETPDGTYEAVGEHFQGNPYNLPYDILWKHGAAEIPDAVFPDLEDRTFEGVSNYLNENAMEGIVFWLDGKPVCKIKRTDFGFEWPIKEARMCSNSCEAMCMDD